MTPQDLARLVQAQSRLVIAARYSQWQADAEVVVVKDGPKYIKIDRGTVGNMSGFLMIERETGEIYGIKAYGKVHKGHHYGNLATADRYFWGEYYPKDQAPEVTEAAVRAWEQAVARHRAHPFPGGDEEAPPSDLQKCSDPECKSAYIEFFRSTR
jgi:hypothetical protein